MTTYPLDLGCTKTMHDLLGVHVVINARAGRQDLNGRTQDETELYRDAAGIKRAITERIRWYGPHSAFFRRHRCRIEHLISRFDD